MIPTRRPPLGCCARPTRCGSKHTPAATEPRKSRRFITAGFLPCAGQLHASSLTDRRRGIAQVNPPFYLLGTLCRFGRDIVSGPGHVIVSADRPQALAGGDAIADF